MCKKKRIYPKPKCVGHFEQSATGYRLWTFEGIKQFDLSEAREFRAERDALKDILDLERKDLTSKDDCIILN